METDHALVAGQGDIEEDAPAPAPESSPDEAHRLSAAAELAAYLSSARNMLARCEALSMAARGDRLGPIHAAARLMSANAKVAKVLAHVVFVESRHRSIVEKEQPLKRRIGQLNANFSPEGEDKRNDARAELRRRLDHLVEHARRERERLEDLNIASCI